jgi:serine protease
MKSIRSLPCAPLLASLVLALSAAPASAADAARVIVKFKTSTTAQAMSAASGTQAATHHAQALSQRTGLALTDGRVINSRLQVVRAAGLSSAQLAARLAKESDVEYAVVDERRHAAAAPNDTLYAAGQAATTPAVGQWYLRAPTSTVLSAINAEGAWTQTTGAGVVVAVLDTGVRFEHPDLAMKLYPGYDFVSDADVSNDGDARDSNAADPGDWVTSAEATADCTAEDSSWHGTQTAGLIGAAANNGIGMAGAGGDVMILPLRVLGRCGGFDSDIMAAMLWAVGQTVSGVPANTHPAKVLNLSLGSAPDSSGCPQSYVDTIKAVNDAGAVVVVSAGNDGLAVNMPAACAGAIAVAGVRHAGTKVGFSSLGPQVAISAPAGNCVVTTGPCQYALLTTTDSGTTVPASSTYSDASKPSVGTSFSAPLVAGTAALMFSAKPSLTAAEVLSTLKSSARAFPSASATGVASCQAPTGAAQDECACTTTTCGAGLLDANAAVAAVATAGQVIPVISFDTSTATIGASFTLDSSRSVLPTGRSVLAYAWSIVSGDSFATVTSATNAATATLSGGAQGTVVVRLSLTDDLNSVTTRDVSIAVGGPVSSSGGTTTPTTPTTTLPQGQSSGGGALGLHWLLGLTMAIVVLAERNRRLRLRKTRSLVAPGLPPR